MSKEQEPTPDFETLIRECEAPSELQCFVVDIDEVTAKALLKHFNISNRPYMTGTAKLYASEMLRGKWKLNGEPLIFGINDDGEVDGISMQHRCNAIIEANKQYKAKGDKAAELYPNAILSLHTVIIYNVPIESADTVDIGVTRKHHDVLFRDEWVASVIPDEWNDTPSHRKTWVKCLAGAARLVWLREGGATVSSAPKFIISEMLEFIKDKHSELCEFVSAVLSASQEEGNGLRISLPYIAGLTYVSCLNEDGTVDQHTKDNVLDVVLALAQNQCPPGSAGHALASYWNKLNSTPGSNDRDIEIIGPFIKAFKAVISGESVTPKKLELTKKEAENYKFDPPLFEGWDTSCFIRAGEIKSDMVSMMEKVKQEREEAKAKKELEREAARKAKAEAKIKAEAEVEAARKNAPDVTNTMATMSKMIKRKPVAAKS